MSIKLPRYAQQFRIDNYRYRVLWGGRGSAKSQTIATLLLLYGASRKIRVGCFREIMESIADSSHKLLKDIIEDTPTLSAHYTVTQNAIRGKNGTEFIFKGLRYNVTEIKGMQGIDYAWVEEAANVSENSWTTLIPTIRQDNSEIWISFNPEQEDSATYKRFIISPPDNALVMRVNYWDNPFFPDVLREEMENDKKRDYNQYLHIWEGELKNNIDAQVFKNWKIEDFEIPADAELLHGADWGFSIDPNAVNRLFIIGKTIYISHEAHGEHTEIDDIPELWETIPDIKKYVVRADSARPELISKMNGMGFNVKPSEKGAGSVEAGILFLQNYNIIIHPRCKHTAAEFAKFSYKIHRLTGDILPQTIDAYNHHLDSIRYALEPLIKNNLRKSIWE